MTSPGESTRAPRPPDTLEYAPIPAAPTGAPSLLASLAVVAVTLGFALAWRAITAPRIRAPLAVALISSPVIAIVLGYLARHRSQPASRRTRALALSALVIGWLQLILVTGAAMLPELGGRGSVETRGRVRCGSNLRQIGLGLLLYANANHGRLPPSLDLLLADPSADISADVLICPSTIDIPATGPTTQFVVADFRYSPRRCSYVYLPPNARLRALNPDQVVAYENPTNHAGQGMNVLFAEGHVEWFQPHAATRLLSELAAGHNPPRPSAVQP